MLNSQKCKTSLSDINSGIGKEEKRLFGRSSGCLSWPPRTVFPVKTVTFLRFYRILRNRPIPRQEITLFSPQTERSCQAGGNQQKLTEKCKKSIKRCYSETVLRSLSSRPEPY